jgi:hypothetical protein
MRLAIVESILSLARPWRVTLTVASPELLCYSAQSGAVWTVAELEYKWLGSDASWLRFFSTCLISFLDAFAAEMA